MRANFDREPDPDETESYSIVHDGYRLVHNVTRPDGWPEHELFDHVADPLNLNDVAAEHPDRVADLSQKLELWKRWAEANRIDAGDADKVIDFHALRHTFISNLARGGVHPKVAMDVARHSTIELTMRAYTHTLLPDRAAALDALPDVDDSPAKNLTKTA